MKKLVTLVVFASLFIAISCDVPESVERLGSARAIADDVAEQWKLNWISSSYTPDSGYSWEQTTGCSLSSVYLYISPYNSGASIHNLYPCSSLTYSQSYMNNDFVNNGIGVETWSSMSGESVNYALSDDGNPIIAFQRTFSGLGPARVYYVTFNYNKTVMYWDEKDMPSGEYRSITWVKSSDCLGSC